MVNAIEFIDQAEPLHVPAPLFYVVFAARHGDDNFRMRGVFSKPEDANTMRDQLNADKTGLYLGAACVDQLTMEQIKDMLAEERLGELNETIRALAGVEKDR